MKSQLLGSARWLYGILDIVSTARGAHPPPNSSGASSRSSASADRDLLEVWGGILVFLTSSSI